MGTPPKPPSADDLPFDLPRVTRAQRARAARLGEMLRRSYPDAHCELRYTTPHELLVATILSAQSTDAGVNRATPALFERFPTPADYARATPEEIEPYIRSLGFFRNKAQAVHRSMTDVVGRFGGEVPRTMGELLTLHGVARKTANVVLGNAYGVQAGIPVDTHVERLSVRLGLVKAGTTTQMIERHLMALFPRETWCDLSHQIIWHGRRACKARMACCSGHDICREFGRACELPRGGKAAPTVTDASETPTDAAGQAPGPVKQPARKAGALKRPGRKA
ncbi:MAG: endonuclease III [Planctomycetota bacterium]|nr:endonuclease III [Planctomycetota bacterium]